MIYYEIMPIIEIDNPAATEGSCEYWKNELANSKILLYKINKAIFAIAQTNIQRYTLDTGQSSHTVVRADLPALIEQRDALKKSIREIELFLGIGKSSVKQVRPGF
jgi:hypothetical protein